MFALRTLMLIVVVLGLGSFSVPSLRAQDRAAEIKKLQKERSDLLDNVLGQLVEQFKAGRADMTELLRARREALQAKLDLHQSPKERIDVLRQSVQVATQIVQIAEARASAGRATNTGLLRARAGLLEARIELLREEQKLENEKGQN